jgi:hypothetical protein
VDELIVSPAGNPVAVYVVGVFPDGIVYSNRIDRAVLTITPDFRTGKPSPIGIAPVTA